MGRQASREHRLSKDRAYPSVGDWDAPKPEVASNEAETTSAPQTETSRIISQGLNEETATPSSHAPMSVTDINAALDARHDEMTADELTYLVQSNFSGSMLSLRQLKPFIQEVKRRFKHLPRKMGVDGKYKTIAGHRNFKSWCDGVLHRTDRAVRYMLAKAHKPKQKEKKGENKKDTISTLSARVEKYLLRNIEYVQEEIGFDEVLAFIETTIKVLQQEKDIWSGAESSEPTKTDRTQGGAA